MSVSANMSTVKSLITVTNMAYVVAAIYFIVVAAAGEATPYSIGVALLCLISVGLALRKEWFFSVPWRVATAAFALILFLAQVLAASNETSTAAGLGSLLINIVLLLVFLGVLLSTLHDSVKKESEEEKEEEEKEVELDKKKREAKKLTYEV